MNTNIEFRFVTRTLSEDYRVFYDRGRKQLDDVEEFAPLRKKGRIIPEEGTTLALFEEDNKIFLIASGMKFGNHDKVGRAIRFSFCQIFQGNGIEEREKAFSAFSLLMSSMPDIQEEAKELIQEIPKKKTNSQGQEVLSEDVNFRQDEFMTLLQSRRKRNLSFKRAENGQSYNADSCLWPAKGCVLKWIETEPDVISCYRIEAESEEKSPLNSGTQLKRYSWVMVLVIAVCAIAAGIMLIHNNKISEEQAEIPKPSHVLPEIAVSSDESPDKGGTL